MVRQDKGGVEVRGYEDHRMREADGRGGGGKEGAGRLSVVLVGFMSVFYFSILSTFYPHAPQILTGSLIQT